MGGGRGWLRRLRRWGLEHLKVREMGWHVSRDYSEFLVYHALWFGRWKSDQD